MPPLHLLFGRHMSIMNSAINLNPELASNKEGIERDRENRKFAETRASTASTEVFDYHTRARIVLEKIGTCQDSIGLSEKLCISGNSS
jgi:hypothetical protein